LVLFYTSYPLLVHFTGLQSFNPDREQILRTSSNNHIRLIQNAFFYRFDLHGQMETVEAR
jgi:hypothetical protein